MKSRWFATLLLFASSFTVAATSPDRPLVFDGVLRDGAAGAEASTAELQAALKTASAIVLDARAFEEYALVYGGH